MKLDDLKVESFVTKLNAEELAKAQGGAASATEYTGLTSKCNPKTTESKVDTCQNTTKCIKEEAAPVQHFPG